MATLETLATAPLMGGMAGSGMAGSGMAGSGMAGGVGGATFLVPLLALLTVGALLAAGVVGIRALTAETGDGPARARSDETPVERLQRRYADGELTEGEFERALERELEREGTDGPGTGPGAGSDLTGDAERTR
ncbi:SHOCT domain-containing protein [Halorubrum xinjiangense]|uniref:SHOCT domain-containing protein n=1 Tax=Halorubrum xinjiangense TaxID=261291 RepID=UPI003C703F74